MESLIYLLQTFCAIITVAISVIIYQYFTRYLNYWKNRGVPGPTPLPFFGNMLSNMLNPLNDLEVQRHRKYGRIYGTLEFSKPVITVADPELIREFAIKNFNNFRNRFNLVPGDKFISETLLMLKDDHWKAVRNLLSPVFTSKQIKRMFHYVDKCSENMLEHIDSIVDTEVSLKQLMMLFTMDTIAKCAFGMDTNAYKNPNDEFIKNALNAVNFSGWRAFKTLVTPSFLQKILDAQLMPQEMQEYFTQLVHSIIINRKQSNVQRNDFVNLLLSLEDCSKETQIENIDRGGLLSENKEDNDMNSESMKTKNKKKTLTEREILAQCFTFFVAGYETTSTLLSFTLYALAMNPDIQEKLHQEASKFFSETKKADFESINSLQYLDCVINESLRMYSPVVVLDRVVQEDCFLGDTGIELQKGTIVNIPFYAVHHDPEFFPEPNVFKPDRFLPENSHLIEPYTFIPFGVGPRICIGMRFALMNAKIFLLKFINEFEVIKTENTDETPRYKSSRALISAEPLMVKLSKRRQH